MDPFLSPSPQLLMATGMDQSGQVRQVTRGAYLRETLDVETWQEEEDVPRCVVCGESDIAYGDEIVWHPMPEIALRAIAVAHPACAVRNGYRLRWPK